MCMEATSGLTKSCASLWPPPVSFKNCHSSSLSPLSHTLNNQLGCISKQFKTSLLLLIIEKLRLLRIHAPPTHSPICVLWTVLSCTLTPPPPHPPPDSTQNLDGAQSYTALVCYGQFWSITIEGEAKSWTDQRSPQVSPPWNDQNVGLWFCSQLKSIVNVPYK
jgi:hypothetical protein